MMHITELDPLPLTEDQMRDVEIANLKARVEDLEKKVSALIAGRDLESGAYDVTPMLKERVQRNVSSVL